MRRAGARLLIGTALAAAVLAVPALATAQDTEQNAQIEITKVVDGTIPEGTTFVVAVDCPAVNPNGDPGPQTVALEFGATGGTQSLEISRSAPVCTVTETDDAGADTVTYEAGRQLFDGCTVDPSADDAVVDFTDPTDADVVCEVIVTNSFPDTQPADVEQAPAADVVEAEPAFTG